MNNNLQIALFQRIKKLVKAHESHVAVVSELLKMGEHSARRRINGEIELKVSELLILCNSFGLSLGQLANPFPDTVSFYREPESLFEGQSGLQSGFDYLFDSLKELQDAQESEIIYLCMEIPVFHLLQVRALREFKMYYWKTIESTNDHRDELFEFGLRPDLQKLDPLIDSITKMYNQIPSTEIVFRRAFATTIYQILFFLESRKFADPRTALFLFDQLIELANHIKRQAQLGQKFLFGKDPLGEESKVPFQMFHNEMIHSQNTAYIRIDDSISVFLENNVLSFMKTTDPHFCNRTLQSLKRVMAKSIPISSVAERERNRFFHMLIEDVLVAKKKASGFLGNIN